jgi:hypothetical protein
MHQLGQLFFAAAIIAVTARLADRASRRVRRAWDAAIMARVPDHLRAD